MSAHRALQKIMRGENMFAIFIYGKKEDSAPVSRVLYPAYPLR